MRYSQQLKEREAHSIDIDEDEVLRPLLLSQLSIHYMKALAELDAIEAELDILRSIPPTTETPQRGEDERERKRKEDEHMWRLDGIDRDKYGNERLLDDDGKILRPFTILPSSSSASATRLRLQSEVFRPSHRLPTMTIDEFLDREYQMGNVLQGGGASSSAQVEKEKEEKRAEGEDDTLKGYLNEEDKLAEKRAWDEWTDDNKRGSGNRIGRS